MPRYLMERPSPPDWDDVQVDEAAHFSQQVREERDRRRKVDELPG